MNKNIITQERLDAFLNGEMTVEQTLDFLEQAAFDPQIEELLPQKDQESQITEQRMNSAMELARDYGHFLPVASMAADDERNLCDVQCEQFLLKKYGRNCVEEQLLSEAKKNYWLEDQGMPLYNMGKLLEAEGLIVRRIYGADLNVLSDSLKQQSVMVVVNGDVLKGKDVSPFADKAPNHAVVVISLDLQNRKVVMFNPGEDNDEKEYNLDVFALAWAESRNYMLVVREMAYPDEYIPSPIDVSNVSLSPELLELTDAIAENAHNVWAAEKIRKNPNLRYAPLDEEGHEKPGCNHFFRPYALLSEEDKKPDVDMALNTIKLLKRLGYRLVNVNDLHRCPVCGNSIEKHHLFCSHCGKELEWQDFV